MGVWGDIKGVANKVGSAIVHPENTISDFSTAIGLKHAAPPDPAQGPDAAAERGFASQLRQQYANTTPGQAQQVAPAQAQYQTLDQGQADQSRQIANQNIAGLQGVASGATPTAADALLTQGTDQAAARARGMAAAYSRSNPGAALRAGLAASGQAQQAATSQAAMQKSQEQAQARGQIGSLADSMRGADLAAAGQNQQAFNQNQQFNTTTGLEGQKSNQAADLQQQGLNNQYQLGLGNLASSTTVAPINASVANQQIQAATNAANQQGAGALLSAVGSVSDRAAKTNVKPVSLANALAKSVHGVSFTYKPGADDGGDHVGIIAQDLEKALPGAVKKGPDGLKRVDTGHLSLGLAGATAELAKRLRAVEARR